MRFAFYSITIILLGACGPASVTAPCRCPESSPAGQVRRPPPPVVQGNDTAKEALALFLARELIPALTFEDSEAAQYILRNVSDLPGVSDVAVWTGKSELTLISETWQTALPSPADEIYKWQSLCSEKTAEPHRIEGNDTTIYQVPICSSESTEPDAQLIGVAAIQFSP